MKKKSKVNKKQVFHIEAIPYKQDIVVVINGDLSDLIKFYKKINGERANKNIEYLKENCSNESLLEGQQQGMIIPGMPYGFVIVVKHLDSWLETVGTVSHECNHLVHYIMRHVRIILTEESEEAYTYLQEHLLEKILEKMY